MGMQMTKLPIIVQFIHCISTQTHITTTLCSSGGYSKRRPTCTDAYIHIHRYDYVHTYKHIHTYIVHAYTYKHTYIHAYIYTHIIKIESCLKKEYLTRQSRLVCL